MRIVVDASVAKAAGAARANAGDPAPAAVTALEAVRSGGHSVAMGRQLKAEWQKHAGRFAVRWLHTMIGQKRFAHVDEAARAGETELLEAAADLPGNGPTEVAKDTHLLAAAMLTDRRIVALDDRQRRLLRRIPVPEAILDGLHWVSPTDSGAVAWLEAGALDDDARLLIAPH